MDIYYAKAALYIYPHIDVYAKRLTKLVNKRAKQSMNDLRPVDIQAFEITKLTFQKEMLIELKRMVEKALSNFSEEDMKYIAYKYFKIKEGIEFDYTDRQYFHKQVKLIKLFSAYLKLEGGTNKWFEDNPCEIFQGVVDKVIEHDNLQQNKNPKVKEV